MQAFFLAALAFALIAVMFALQNVVPVQVTFLAWTFEGSLAVVLFVAFILGALVSVLVSAPSMVKARMTAKSLHRQIAALEDRLRNRERDHQPAETKAIPPPSAKPMADVSRGRDSQAVRSAS